MVDERRGARLRDLPKLERRLFVVAAVVVALPFLLGATGAATDGWYPVGDDAVILTASREVGTAHPPLLGESTTSEKYGVASNHPGPLVFYVYAPFVALGGGTAGLLAGAAAVNATSMVLIGYVTLRTAGRRHALWAWIAVLATGLSIGGSAYLYRPFKSNVAILPFLLFLFLTWALVSGKHRFLPLWVLAGSFAASATVQNLLRPVGPRSVLVVMEGVGGALEASGLRTDLTRPPGLGARDGPAQTTGSGRLLVVPSFVPAPGGRWTPIATYEPDDRDQELARTAADDAAAYVRSASATLSPVARQALPQILCPQLAFEPGTCPAADVLLTGPRPLDRAPDWIAALIVVEHFDEFMPFTLLDLPEPPPAELLARVRGSWVDIPVTIYRHEGPLG